MLQLKQARFYRGPNVFFSSSGLIEVLEGDERGLDPAGWRPGEVELSNLLDRLFQVFPVAGESTALTAPRGITQAPFPLVVLLLSLSESLLRDFCCRPAMGRLLSASGSRWRLFLPCDEAAIGHSALALAVETGNALPALLTGAGADLLAALGARYREARATMRRHGLNQSNMALARGALVRGIPHYRLAVPGQFLQLGQGCKRKRVMETATEDTSSIGQMISRDKLLTAFLLQGQGLPTSQPQAVTSLAEVREVAQRLGYPLVVKPRSSGKGKGVTVNIGDQAELLTAYKSAAGYASGIIVERYLAGDDHRLLVVGGRFVAAAKRFPAEVVGDGEHSVRQLVDQLNRDPRRGMPFERVLERVEIDSEAERLIAAVGLGLDAVPTAGQRVRLRDAGNLSRGGTSIDVTDLIHPDNRDLAERVARLVGLDVTGIDFLTPDIRRSWRSLPCGILEVNATPGLRPHLAANPGRDVVAPIIDHLFLPGTDGRVPTAGITGSLGKTTTCRMVATILAEKYQQVALATTTGAWVGRDRIRGGDVAGGGMASILLQDPRVGAGVFELARGGLVKLGMALDAVDVGAVLNIHDNHLGLDGVKSRIDLARVKRVVVENARHMAVLNADEPLCLAMREHIKAPRVCLVSSRPDNPVLLEHLAGGGIAAYLTGVGTSTRLCLHQEKAEIGSLPAGEIPAAWGGSYQPAMVNALFAAAIAYGMGCEFQLIRQALLQFQSNLETNPGRMNLYRGLPYSLLLTEADGAVPMGALANFVAGFAVSGERRLMLCAAGNRPDAFIMASARAVAGGFSLYVCTDYYQLRGRAPGEVARLLAQGLEGAGVPRGRILVVSPLEEAMRVAVEGAGPGDLVVFNTNGRQAELTLRQLRELSS